MDRLNLNYSLKNIPTPSLNTYRKRLIEKVESVIKRMRWKAFFFDRDEDDKDMDTNSNFGLKSRKCPPQVADMKEFEHDLLHMVENIQFRNCNDPFQSKLRRDLKTINSSNEILVSADKTRNIYKMSTDNYRKLLNENITQKYKRADDRTVTNINNKLITIAKELQIDDRISPMEEKQAFITLKDHKDNFNNNPTCRLINPAKSEMGKVSKVILESINETIRKASKAN